MCIMTHMERKHILLHKRQVKELSKVSKKTGAPIAELIRRAIDFFLGYLKKGGQP